MPQHWVELQAYLCLNFSEVCFAGMVQLFGMKLPERLITRSIFVMNLYDFLLDKFYQLQILCHL